jgi:hypothetical protein
MTLRAIRRSGCLPVPCPSDEGFVAIYKNEEAPIFYRPTTGLSPISNEALSALEMALAGR